MRNLLSILLVFLCFSSTVKAQNDGSYKQQIYYTPKGVMKLVAEGADSVLNITSNDVSIILNYETSDFVLRFDANSLRTGIDSLDAKLDSLEDYTIRYKGHLELNYIKTEKHLPQDFEVSGRLEVENQDYGLIKGKGHIEHVADGTYPCLLSMRFSVIKGDLEKELTLPIAWDRINIEVDQAILDKELY